MPSTPDKPIGKPRRRTAKLELIRRRTAQAVFLAEFAKHGNLTAAARVADTHRDTIYHWQEHDDNFSVRFHQAEAEAADAIRAELHRRAVEGVERPMVSAGRVVMLKGQPVMERVYSDSLMLALARARCPEFREQTHVDITSGGERLVGIADAITALLNGPAHTVEAVGILDAIAERADSEASR